MKSRSRAIVILSVLFGYVLLQFIWWEILLVRQTSALAREREKLAALSVSDHRQLEREIGDLQERRTKQILMIVGEGTVFLLLLLYGIYRIRKAQENEVAFSARQNNFFLSITHELKTPITAMKLQLQTLKKPGVGTELQQRLIEGALSENERLNSLINNILLASRLDAGGMELKREKTDLAELTEKILARYYQPQLSSGVIQMSLHKNNFCLTDKDAFTSIVTNLVDNALKYSAASPAVQVSVSGDGGKCVFAVSDNGPGIADIEKKKIFDRFYRSGREETRNSKGTGLGLYIVRNLAAGHGAEVRVGDNRPKGSIFEVIFDAC